MWKIFVLTEELNKVEKLQIYQTFRFYMNVIETFL